MRNALKQNDIKDVGLADTNVRTYLLNHTSLTRGERLHKNIFDKNKSNSAAVLAIKLRNDIDDLLITANHWGAAREDRPGEELQKTLSDIFGTLHKNVPKATPVYFLRTIAERFFPNDLSKKAALSLQFGVGHCYHPLKDAPPSKMSKSYLLKAVHKLKRIFA